jgi:hypothetical protein
LGCACPGVNALTANIDGPFELDFDRGTFDPSQFSVSSTGFGNLGRNALRGPRMFTYDLALFRDFALAEVSRIELRAEAYNITNHTNWANPVSSFGNAGFGRPVQTLNGIAGRQFQLAARLVF